MAYATARTKASSEVYCASLAHKLWSMAKGLDQADTRAHTMHQRQDRVSVGQQMVPTQGQRDDGMSEDVRVAVELNRPVEGPADG